ncbi:putative alpha-mannosyltransferase [Podospora aff. communis PSN243]|uniref:Alpha-mannosyltransferase n=1 Tax=Podospora aff. communis PSN243 TaxID=3040156 RepID=A0AAV9GK56_9PEZI|nr:putative alpha-mannosyltransferase [Podospora aff. communis PSN243]
MTLPTLTELQHLTTSDLPPPSALVLLLAVLAALVLHRIRSPPTPTTPPPTKKPPTRPYGQWTPSPYRIPLPPPYPNWSLTDTKPLPYRPFRYGPKYHVTMGLRTVSSDDWIELDNHFPKYHADKARRLAERGDRCVVTTPEAWDAAVELLEELARYLPARYPSLYQKEGTVLRNLWSGEEFDVAARPLKEDPMAICARLVQDDLAIMIEREDGQYYFLAGAILLAGFWRLEDKLGMCLSEIHTSGEVPQYKERLERGMMNFFRRVKPEEMVARNNYFMQVDDGLAWSWSIGSEDRKEIGGWKEAEKNRAVEHHWFRSERQTLRRLPRSGGVVFTIRTYFHPVVEVAEEDYVPGRLASAVRSWGEDVGKYKGRERYGEVLLEYLDRKHEEQVKRGLDLSREEEVGGYPF